MIKCSALVCKRWDEVIGNSLEIMGRFQLNSKEEIRSKRKYQTAKITRLQKSLDVISGQKLQSLELHYAEVINLSTFIAILNEFSSLKVLAVSLDIPFDDVSENSNFQKVQINLDELDCSVEIIHIFDCKSIKKMKILWNYVNTNWRTMAIDFIKQQSNVQDLTFNGYYFNEFFTNPEIFEFKFALNKLRLDYSHGHNNVAHYEKLIEFLDRHKQSLTGLELHFCTEPEYAHQIKLLHDYVLENLDNLKHIEFGHICSEFGEEEDKFPFNELPSPTRATINIESVKTDFYTNENNNIQFYAMFPNLKHLSMEDVSFQPTTTMSINLETLTFCSYNGDTDPSRDFAYFPKLKELYISGDLYDNDISAFINRHSNTLEKLTINDCDAVTYQTTKSILNCTNLKYLELCFGNVNRFVVGMLNEIDLKTKRFTLKICHSSHGYHTFVFPDDKAIWDKKIDRLKLNISCRSCALQ